MGIPERIFGLLHEGIPGVISEAVTSIITSCFEVVGEGGGELAKCDIS